MALTSVVRGTNLPNTATKADLHGLVDNAVISVRDIANADFTATPAIADSKLATIATPGKINTSALTTTSKAAGDFLYSPDGLTWDRLPVGTAGQRLKVISPTIDLMEYATDGAAQAAYVSNDPEPYRSNGDIYTDDMTSLSGWNNGGTTQETFDGKSCFKFVNASGITGCNRDLGTFGATKAVFSISTYFDSLGTIAASDYFFIDFVYDTTKYIRISFDVAGLRIWNDIGGGVLVGAGDVVEDIWQEWTFEVNFTTFKVDIYLNKILKYSNISCEVTGGGLTPGNCALLQIGNTSKVTYIDWLKAGSSEGSLQSYSEATIKTQGAYSLKAIALITDSLNKTLTRTVSPTIDLSGVNTIKFDIYSSRTGSNIKIGIHDSGGTTTEITPNITSANAWQTITWDISAVSDADKDAIDSLKITPVNADATNTFYIDNIIPSPLLKIGWVTP